MASIVVPAQPAHEVVIVDGETTPTDASIQRERTHELTKEKVAEVAGLTVEKDDSNEDASSILVQLDEEEEEEDPEQGSDDGWTPEDGYDYEYNNDDWRDPDKDQTDDDFTACSAEECGWCGRCMY